MLEYINCELFTYALTIGMTPQQYWYDNPQWFFNYADSYKNRSKIETEKADYLAWQTGASVKSALATTAILSLMVDGKEARRVLKGVKYQELPYFMLVEREKNKGKPRIFTAEELKAEREKLFNFINKIKPKK